MKNMEHEFLHFKARTNYWKWKSKSGLPLTIIGWCQFITCTKRKFKVPDQLLTNVKLSLICNYPHYPSVLSRKFESDPTTLIEIAVYNCRGTLNVLQSCFPPFIFSPSVSSQNPRCYPALACFDVASFSKFAVSDSAP